LPWFSGKDGLGGKATYDKTTNSTTLSLTYNGITVNILYNINNVPRDLIFLSYFNPKISALIAAYGTYSQGHAKPKDAGVLTALYNYRNQMSYITLSDLLEYFKKIWCDTSKTGETPVIKEPNTSTNSNSPTPYR